jgi:hypothetical protein
MFADGHTDYQENACACRKPSGQPLLSEALPKTALKFAVLEHIATLNQTIWEHPLAVQHERLGHFPKHDFQRKSGGWCKGWTA